MAFQQKTVFTEAEKEYAKWEMFERDVPRGLVPGNPYRLGNPEYGKPGALYPWMLYKAHRMPNGKWGLAMDEPQFFGFRDANEWERARQQAFQFTTSCQMTVHNDVEHKRARENGWRDNPTEALQFAEALDKLMGDEAAERNYRDRNMSDKAKAEVDKAEADHFGHLPEIPEQPRARKVASPEVRQKRIDALAKARAAKSAKKAGSVSP